MSATRMSNVDAAWLGMDAPDNLMMITAVLWFDEQVDWDRLTDVIGARLIGRFPKFSQRPLPSRTPFEQPVWSDDPEFAIQAHLVHTKLSDEAAGPRDASLGGDAALGRLVSRLLSQPLDMRRSPWQFHLVDGYVDGSGHACRSAIVARLHHCIADGIALAGVLLSLTDDAPDDGPDGAPDAAFGDLTGGAVGVRSARRPGLVRRLAEGTDDVSDVAAAAGLTVGRPWLRPRRAVRSLRFGWDIVVTGLGILFASRDPRTRFNGRLGTAKSAAWTRELDLAVVKSVAARLGVSVNDVLLAVTAGALRRHLLEHGDRAHDLRVFVPVNLRPPDQPVRAELGNRFGVVFIRLPVGEPDAHTRVRLVHERMTQVKGSAQAAATFAILSIVGALPTWGHTLAIRALGAKTTAVITNVPGPRAQVFLAGSAMRSMVFWVPQAGSVGLGVSILSYAGRVRVGVAADCNLVPDPGALVRGVEAELDELATATRPPRPGTATRPQRPDHSDPAIATRP